MICPNFYFTFIRTGEAVTCFLASDKTGQRNGINIKIPFAEGNICPLKDVRPLLLNVNAFFNTVDGVKK